MYKYKVNLRHEPNPDINYVNGSGYWGLPIDKNNILITANTLQEIQDKFDDWLAAFRDYLNCDHVLQTEVKFLFCETIKDAEIIEESV